MKAMILAAGLGTRLRPLTDTVPKALIKIADKPMLEWVILRLKKAGITELIINTHHLADQVHTYLRCHPFADLNIKVSHEEQILDTGGGIKKARDFFDDGQPFLVHNVDIISTFDLGEMLEFHRQHQARVTLAVQKRPGNRLLLMDSRNRLCGRQPVNDTIFNPPEFAHPPYFAVAFNGIHIIDPQIFPLLTETGAFPIFEVYLRLLKNNERILCYDIGTSYWLDLGKTSALVSLEKDLKSGKIILP